MTLEDNIKAKILEWDEEDLIEVCKSAIEICYIENKRKII